MIIFTSFLTTIPLWWHNVCWLSSSLYSRVCLLSVTPSFCFRQELVRCSNFPCILFWDSACLGFIASVRCVEWANCYFWVIIAAMFVCLDRDDLCLARSPPLQWFSFAFSPRSTSAILFLSAERRSVTNPLTGPSSVPSEAPGVMWCVVTMSDRNHLLWDEGGHSLATIVYVWPGVRVVLAPVWPVTRRGGGQSQTDGAGAGGVARADIAGNPQQAGLCHWQCLAISSARPTGNGHSSGQPCPLPHCPAGVHPTSTQTRHAQRFVNDWMLSSLGLGLGGRSLTYGPTVVKV